jgi:hypothetical protein
MVVTAGVRAVCTVGDVGCARDAVDAGCAVVSAGEPRAADPRSVDVETVELGLLSTRFEIAVRFGFDGFVAGPAAVALLAEVLGLEVAVVGSVIVVLVTVVLAPPEASTPPSCGSVDDCVEVLVDAWVGDDAVPVFVGSVLGGDDVESLDEEVLDDASLGSASAIAGLVAIAMPTPSATASAPTRPM